MTRFFPSGSVFGSGPGGSINPGPCRNLRSESVSVVEVMLHGFRDNFEECAKILESSDNTWGTGELPVAKNIPRLVLRGYPWRKGLSMVDQPHQILQARRVSSPRPIDVMVARPEISSTTSIHQISIHIDTNMNV